YNGANSTNQKSCVLQIRISLPKANIISSTNDASCSGSQIGTTRQSSSETCPTGYEGKIIETCTEANSWKVTERFCNPVNCGDNSVYKDTRKISCPTNYNGDITQTCTESGIWSNTQYDCLKKDIACSDPGKILKDPCPIGQEGIAQSNCQPTGLYTLTSQACNIMQCPSYPGHGAGKIGD